MNEEPKGSFLPIAIAGGAHLACCLGLVLFATGGISIGGWLGNFNAWGVAGIAAAVGVAIVLMRRLRKPALAGTEREPPAVLKGDQ